MPNPTADEILTQKHVRTFIQFGAARPANVPQYSGQDAQYLALQGVSAHESGAIDPIWVPHPSRPGQYRLVGRTITAPDLTTATLVMREMHGQIPRQLGRIGCQFNLYQNLGVCKDLSDFVGGWSDWVEIYAGALVTDKDLGDRSAFGEDAAHEDSLSITLSDYYVVGKLNFGEGAATQVTLEVLDITYSGRAQCADCGPANDGSQWIYAIVKSSGSTPGTAPKLLYSTDGGSTWTAATVTGLGDTENPQAVRVIGNYLVVFTRTAGGPTLSGYYWAEINAQTGAPGTFTRVSGTSGGFVASFQIYDVYVANPREVYLCADGGYIYKSTDITTGVSVVSAGSATSTALQRIHGVDETIVAVGGSGVVVKSANRGQTWAATTASPVTTTLQALWVLDRNRYWVGSNGGKLYYTLNGGESWAEKTFSGSGSGQVRDIVFATDEVGYISHDTSTPTARIFSTWNGGYSWGNTSPRITNLPTFNRANRLAVPRDTDSTVMANNLAVAGLAGDASDGIILVAAAAKL